MERIPIKSGSDAMIVYNSKYIPACSRSGWFPDFVIRSKVGIKIISNII